VQTLLQLERFRGEGRKGKGKGSPVSTSPVSFFEKRAKRGKKKRRGPREMRALQKSLREEKKKERREESTSYPWHPSSLTVGTRKKERGKTFQIRLKGGKKEGKKSSFRPVAFLGYMDDVDIERKGKERRKKLSVPGFLKKTGGEAATVFTPPGNSGQGKGGGTA